jgi:hypothetical protein
VRNPCANIHRPEWRKTIPKALNAFEHEECDSSE